MSFVAPALHAGVGVASESHSLLAIGLMSSAGMRDIAKWRKWTFFL